jgi:hypothetical protein
MTEGSVQYPYTADLPLTVLRKNAANPNEQDERTFNTLVESVAEEGWVEPMASVVPDGDGTFEIVGGHHRFDAATVLGHESAPCWVLDPDKFDRDRRDWTMVKVNVLQGKLNPAKFTALYDRMVKAYGAEVLQSLMGFTSDDAFQKMYVEVKKALPKELQDALDAQKGEIKTIDDLSLVLNRLFREFGETLPSNFMVFSWAGKDVMWIRADDRLWKAVSEIARQVKADGQDMTEVMGGLLDGRLEAVTTAP